MRVLVAMSGGVDSSVVAGLLKSQGHEVIGVTMKLWEGPNGEMPETGCCTASDSEDARKVAAKLDIPYYVLDYTESFSEKVVDNFIDMYARGLTPNPCVECNRSVKFDHFLKQAKKLNCDKVATGHYAKVVEKDKTFELHKADYLDKDQSYVLHMLTSSTLEHVMFPLGTISKPEVRQIAADLGLKTAFKKDSQDICFVGKKDYRNFVGKRIDVSSKGVIVDKYENEVGTHGGIHAYTIGQRKGLEIGGGYGKSQEPWFVADKLTESNQIVAVQGDHHLLYHDSLIADDIHWIDDEPEMPMRCSAKIRYRQASQDCTVSVGEDQTIKVFFADSQRAITPGQSVVFYDGDRCLGGSVIKSRHNE